MNCLNTMLILNDICMSFANLSGLESIYIWKNERETLGQIVLIHREVYLHPHHLEFKAT